MNISNSAIDRFNPRFISKLTKETLALILAGGRGTRLKELTHWRAKPAVPFGGKYRIIDFPLSNCVNSDIRQVGVISQYKAHSLIRHVQKGWSFLRGEFGEFVELLPAQQRMQASWYEGTADAIYQNLDIIRSHNPRFVLVLAGDHIYKMDYGPMLACHVEKNADLTVGCVQIPVSEASSYGVMSVGDNAEIVAFDEKPTNPTPLPGKPDTAMISMGIYVFSAQFLIDQLIKDADDLISNHDFGKDIIPRLVETSRAFAYPFTNGTPGQQPYWRDVGTVDSYWQANMELVSVTPELNLYDKEWPIWTYSEQVPPAKFVFDDEDGRGMAVDSMVSDGCIVSGSKIERALLFNNVRVINSELSGCVVLPDVQVEDGCRIRNAVIDKGARIPSGTIIGEDKTKDEEHFYVSDNGIVLVTPDMLGQKIHFSR